MSLLQILKTLAEKTGKPLELRPGVNATAMGEVRLDMRVYREKEDRWYEVDGGRGPK